MILRIVFISISFQLTLLKFGKEKIPIDSLSSKNQKNVVPFREQIQQFSTVRNILVDVMGSKATEKFLSKSLFFISIGSNDILGYYHSNSSASKEEFLSILGATYETHLTVKFLSLFFLFSLQDIHCVKKIGSWELRLFNSLLNLHGRVYWVLEQESWGLLVSRPLDAVRLKGFLMSPVDVWRIWMTLQELSIQFWMPSCRNSAQNMREWNSHLEIHMKWQSML